jgi:valine--pyruvate aminotransferase
MKSPIAFSDRGERITANSGIHKLMEDLGAALAEGSNLCMMGGGNPAHIPEMEEAFAEELGRLAQNKTQLSGILGDYAPPEGNRAYRQVITDFFTKSYGWKITPQNIAVTGGGQSAFLLLFTLLAGSHRGKAKRILFPIAPEYIGYADQGMDPDTFISCRPHIVETAPRRFRYSIDFDAVEQIPDLAAVCLSRPTNPSSNVLPDEEIHRLSEFALRRGVPLIIDNAYGHPFPGVVFQEASLKFESHWILSFSLSKVGLPGFRSGFLVADESIVHKFGIMNAVAQLSPGNLGPALFSPLLVEGHVEKLVSEIIKPYYKNRCQTAVDLLDKLMPPEIDWSIHEPGGAFFLWLRLRNLGVTSQELYERLKQRGLLVVPGHYFFAGLAEPWEHSQECLRLSYCLPDEMLSKGVGILAEELRSVSRETVQRNVSI